MIIIGLHSRLYPTEFWQIARQDSLAALESLKRESSLEERLEARRGGLACERIAWFDAAWDRDFALCAAARELGVVFAVRVATVVEFLSCAHFLPKYCLLDSRLELALYQKLADSYLLDTKLLAIISESEEIESCARLGIDGVVFRHCLR